MHKFSIHDTDKLLELYHTNNFIAKLWCFVTMKNLIFLWSKGLEMEIKSYSAKRHKVFYLKLNSSFRKELIVWKCHLKNKLTLMRLLNNCNLWMGFCRKKARVTAVLQGWGNGSASTPVHIAENTVFLHGQCKNMCWETSMVTRGGAKEAMGRN